jgi:lipopolysaccharide export system protein LptC
MKKWRAHLKPVVAPLLKRDGQPPDLEFLSIGAARDAGSRQGSFYSRFVRAMKLVLPAAAALLLGAILLWPQLQAERNRFQIGLSGLDPRNPDRLRVLNARFRGTDKQNQPYTVTAESASEADAEGRQVALDSPSADLALSSGAWILARAPEGVFDRDTETLLLKGGVSVFHDDGYEFSSPTARLWLKEGRAEGDDPAEGHGPAGEIKSADGFLLIDKGRRILFKGKSRLILRPGVNSNAPSK